MIEQSIVHLPELVKDIDRPVSNYLVHLSRYSCSIRAAARWSTLTVPFFLTLLPARRVVNRSSHSTNRTPGNSLLKASSLDKILRAWKPTSPPSVLGTPTTTS